MDHWLESIFILVYHLGLWLDQTTRYGPLSALMTTTHMLVIYTRGSWDENSEQISEVVRVGMFVKNIPEEVDMIVMIDVVK